MKTATLTIILLSLTLIVTGCTKKPQTVTPEQTVTPDMQTESIQAVESEQTQAEPEQKVYATEQEEWNALYKTFEGKMDTRGPDPHK